jgi:predicted double-glycine peptidase
MAVARLQNLSVIALAALIIGAATVRDVTAQQPVTEQAQRAQDRPPGEQQRPSGDGDRSSRDEEPQTVQGQLARLKRQQSREESTGERTPVRDSEHQAEVRVQNYVELREKNIVMQRRDYSCGAAALATVCRYYWGDDVSEDLFLAALDLILTDEEIEDRITNGLAMSDLRRAAVKAGYQAVVGKTTFEKLMEAKVPLIVGIQPGGHKHFVVYRGTDADWVYMADPIRGNVRMPVWEFREQWQENALLVIHKPGQKVKQQSALSLRDEDVRRGELNWHLIRTQQSRMPQNKQTLPP